MQQAQQMKNKFQKMKEEFYAKEFTYSSSDKLITLKVSGKKEIKDIQISPELLKNSDNELLADMLIVNINNALANIDKEYEDTLSSLGVPPDMIGGMM